jgi:uracil-DNA glycosylase
MLALETLLEDVRRCRVCLDHPVAAPLPHLPRPVFQLTREARFLIVGQAPGRRAHESGLPFDDPSGDRLRSWLGVGRREFYDPRRFALLPMGFCFPGYDRNGSDLPPRVECAHHWRSRIMARLPNVEFVLCLGRHAQAWHMKPFCRATLTETVRAWRAPYETGPPLLLPLPHPSWRNSAWLKRNPWFEREILPVLRAEVARLTA